MQQAVRRWSDRRMGGGWPRTPQIVGWSATAGGYPGALCRGRSNGS